MERLGNGEFTVKDWENWQRRSLQRLPDVEKRKFLATATKACAKKLHMESYNVERIKSLGEPIAPIPAKNNCSEAKGVNGDNESSLPSNLLLCKGAKIRLTCNLWTAAGLVNGAVGYVHSIIYAERVDPPELPQAIICTFDGYIGPSYLSKVPKSVVIVPAQRTWLHKGKTCHRKQLPVIPAYAVTIHRLQGSTEELVILNPGPDEFAPGLLLVGATRTKSFEDLALDPMPNYERFQKVNRRPEIKRRKEEENRMAGLEEDTMYKFRAVIAESLDIYNRDKPFTSMSTPYKPRRPPPFELPTVSSAPRESRSKLSATARPPVPSRRPAPPRPSAPPRPPAPGRSTSSIASVSPGMARAQQILVNLFLSDELICKRDTKGDGNCFFHAIADQLTDREIRESVARRARHIPLDHHIIRQRVTDFADRQSHEILQDPTILAFLQEMETNDPYGREMFTIWRDYVQQMRQPREWAKELIFRATAIYFCEHIRVIKENFVTVWHGGDQAHDPPMTIVNMDESHFQSVYRWPK